MTSPIRIWLGVAFAAVLAAQPPTSRPQPLGLETAWDIAGTIDDIGAHALRLMPLLERIDARAWVEQGASETYAEQLQSIKEQAKAVGITAQALAKNPEKLSAGLDLDFRIGALNQMLSSVAEGIRKYQSQGDAQALMTMVAQGGTSRDRFQRYLVNLAAQREQELQVMDKEAQRCRAIVTGPAPKPVKKQ